MRTISQFFIFSLIGILFFGCNLKSSKSQIVTDRSSVVQKDNDSLDFYLTERFEKRLFLDETFVFKDGYSINFSDSLDFSQITDRSATFYLGDYFEMPAPGNLDKNGVILQDNQYHTTEIGRRALIAAQAFKKTGSEEARAFFLNQMKWLEENFYHTETYGFWYFQQESPLYKLPPVWPSALSQGWILNACLEAYHITQDNKYLNLVEKALKAYLVPVENGGFMREWNEGEVWFEEYGTERPSRVLNGAIFGLEGVYNLYQDTGFGQAYFRRGSGGS